MASGNFAWSRVFSFSQLFCLFWKKKISSKIHVFRSDQFSLLMYCCLLPSSATVKMDNEENMGNAHYATNGDTPLWTINMGVSGWYDMWYEKCHIIIYNYLIGQYLLLSHQSIFIIISSVDIHYYLISLYSLLSHQSLVKYPQPSLQGKFHKHLYSISTISQYKKSFLF